MKKPLNVPLVIGLAIPVITVVAVMLAIYIPSRYVNPAYDFIYMKGNPYESRFLYAVRDEKIVKQEVPSPAISEPGATPVKLGLATLEPQLYRYTIQTGISTPISFEEAQQLTLDSKQKSPDGYEVGSASGGGVFPFFYEGNHFDDIYIKNNYGSRKLDVQGGYNWQFLAWIIPERQ